MLTKIKDYYLSFVVLFQMMLVIVQLLLPALGWITVERAATLRALLTVGTFLPAVYIVIKRCPYLMIFPFAAYIFFFLWNYALFPESHDFLDSNQSKTLTPVAIMTAIFMLSIRRFTAFLETLTWVSRLSVLLAFLYVLVIKLFPARVDGYSLSFGYSILLFAMFLFRQSGFIDKTLSIILFLFIIAEGSRGPVIVIALYYTIHLVLFVKFRRLWKQAGSVLLVVLLAYGGLTDVVNVQSSRTAILYRQGKIVSHRSGRDRIQGEIIKKIWERPVTGWGIGADRSFIKGYSHNIFLELAVHYGVVVTFFLTASMLTLVISCFNSQKFLGKHGGRSLMIIMLLFGFVPLMVSSSYLISFSFAIMMGYLLRRYRKSRVEKFMLYGKINTRPPYL